jgi:hypothetical protein
LDYGEYLLRRTRRVNPHDFGAPKVGAPVKIGSLWRAARHGLRLGTMLRKIATPLERTRRVDSAWIPEFLILQAGTYVREGD